MKILFDLGHPAHFHLFKHTIRKLLDDNHSVIITVREKENIIKYLLEADSFQYIDLYPNTKSFWGKSITLFKNDLKLLKIIKREQPQLLVSMTSPYAAQISAITGKPHITFVDTEDAKLILNLTIPFTDIIITEDSYLGNINPKKHIPIHTWRPLAYLHPKYFTPKKEVLDIINLSKDDKFFLIRFSAWTASHDWNIKRDVKWKDRYKIIHKLEKEGYVFISSEIPLPKSLEKYKLKISPFYFHDILSFSSGYIGEGHMTARESICLGKPAVLISPRGKIEGCHINLEKKGFLKILASYRDANSHIIEFITNNSSNFTVRVKEEIKEMVDITKFFIWFIENYPASLQIYRENEKNVLYNFKFGE